MSYQGLRHCGLMCADSEYFIADALVPPDVLDGPNSSAVKSRGLIQSPCLCRAGWRELHIQSFVLREIVDCRADAARPCLQLISGLRSQHAKTRSFVLTEQGTRHNETYLHSCFTIGTQTQRRWF